MTADGAPALSVVVMAYRNEATVVSAVRSVLEQPVADPIEVIVVASGGDGAAGAVRRWFPGVPVIERRERLLPGAARNVGAEAARGKVVAFLAADCLAEPEWVAGRLAAHRAGHRAVASAVTNGGPRTPAGWAAHYLLFCARLPGRLPGPVLPPDPAAHGMSFHREELAAIGPFPEDLRVGEDTEAARRLATRGTPIWFEPSVVTAHRGPSGTGAMLRDQFARGRRRSRAGGLVWPDAGAVRLVWRSVLAGRRILSLAVSSVSRGAQRERRHLALALPWMVGGVVAHQLGWLLEQGRMAGARSPLERRVEPDALPRGTEPP